MEFVERGTDPPGAVGLPASALAVFMLVTDHVVALERPALRRRDWPDPAGE
jgi:hypothetical protein